jgi:hypothetical protein
LALVAMLVAVFLAGTSEVLEDSEITTPDA